MSSMRESFMGDLLQEFAGVSFPRARRVDSGGLLRALRLQSSLPHSSADYQGVAVPRDPQFFFPMTRCIFVLGRGDISSPPVCRWTASTEPQSQFQLNGWVGRNEGACAYGRWCRLRRGRHGDRVSDRICHVCCFDSIATLKKKKKKGGNLKTGL